MSNYGCYAKCETKDHLDSLKIREGVSIHASCICGNRGAIIEQVEHAFYRVGGRGKKGFSGAVSTGGMRAKK